jgi:hypothetical protein
VGLKKTTGDKEAVLMVLYGCLTAAVTWLLIQLFMDAIAPAGIVLATLLLLALMTAFLVWVRRMPGDARRRGVVVVAFRPGGPGSSGFHWH